MALTPEQRVLRARIAAHAQHARCADPVAHTAPARKAMRDSFEKQVDPDGVLAPTDRARRAEHARKAHYARLAYASVKASRARREAAS